MNTIKQEKIQEWMKELASISFDLNCLLEDIGREQETTPRTERCDICQRTYTLSEIVKRNGEQLCHYCEADKYPLQDEDIPF